MLKITKREREILDKIATSSDVKAAANSLKLSPSTLYNILYRIRTKYRESRTFVNTILAYRKKSYVLNKVLARKISRKEELQKLVEEEW